MSAIKSYFKEELQPRNLGVDHTKPSDFYLSVWQTNRSSAPLLFLRTLIFLTSIGIVLASITIYIQKGQFSFWFIYLTHWGLSVMTFASFFSVVVSARCYFYGPLSSEFLLPWYARVYWLLFNVAVPIAFLITLFYWTVLFEAGIEEELNHGLDVAVHGINTLLMFLLLFTSSHPSRLLHFYQPTCFAFTYFLFTAVYFLAGGTDAKGHPYIYPVVDWTYPGTTVGVGALTGLLLIVLYLLVVAIAKGRDVISRKYVKPPPIAEEAGVPLRQQTVV
ncbi:protein rolling stone-like [Ostrinia furnacalis]|uniref:protein rolling stone-like n=1 Tax=Ostrinia furnacalis TaxID=93504 RepID=UPI001038CC76|nr:protein rolling stone-like [Ostrinia furnacalis]